MAKKPGKRRVTIVDLARDLDLSVASVSYALNGKPGVSDATRERVLDAAGRLGWQPNHAAKALQAKRSNVIGLVMRREYPGQPMLSDFIVRLIDGLSEELTNRPESLLFETVPDMDSELATYRAWVAQGRVDALALINVSGAADPRLDLVVELGLPAVVVGDVRGESSLPSVWTDDVEAMHLTLEHLVGRGHRRIARLSDGNHLRHLQIRSRAFADTLRDAGLPAGVDVPAALEQPRMDAQLAAMMAAPDHPTAFQFDSAVRAAQALKSLRALGYRVPEDCALVAWDNSVVCEITDPPITTVDRDPFDYGATVGRRILELIDTGRCDDMQGAVSHLIPRGST